MSTISLHLSKQGIWHINKVFIGTIIIIIIIIIIFAICTPDLLVPVPCNMLPSEFTFYGKIMALDRSLAQNLCNKERVDRNHEDIWGNHGIFMDELKINVCRAFPNKLMKKF